jgi:hypothetical protein
MDLIDSEGVEDYQYSSDKLSALPVQMRLVGGTAKTTFFMTSPCFIHFTQVTDILVGTSQNRTTS